MTGPDGVTAHQAEGSHHTVAGHLLASRDNHFCTFL